MMAKCAADPGQVLHFRVDPECPAPTRQNDGDGFCRRRPRGTQFGKFVAFVCRKRWDTFFLNGTVGRNFLFCEKVWHCTLKCCNSQMHSAFMILCMITVKTNFKIT